MINFWKQSLKLIFWPRIITSIITLALLYWWTPTAAFIGACIWAFCGEWLNGMHVYATQILREDHHDH